MQTRDGVAAEPDTAVGRLNLRPPVIVSADSTIRSVAGTLRTENVGSVLIDTRPSSFATERDLVQALAEGLDPSSPITRVATMAPVWVPPSLSVVNAAALMVRMGMRHLPILDHGGQALGVLSMRDAFDVLLQSVEPSRWLASFESFLRVDY
jgi:CBS domain-containing protein